MKHLALTTLFATAATPTLAHGGAHLHPHGIEALVALAALASVVMLLALRGR